MSISTVPLEPGVFVHGETFASGVSTAWRTNSLGLCVDGPDGEPGVVSVGPDGLVRTVESRAVDGSSFRVRMRDDGTVQSVTVDGVVVRPTQSVATVSARFPTFDFTAPAASAA